jgi:hypothetical protein
MNGTTNFLTAVMLLLPSISFADEAFRPVPGVFAPMEKAHIYRGELVFVDHANRRGSIRVEGSGMFFRNSPHPFAMLPYGMIRRHGAPSDLRDIPLGTVMHVKAFLPPDPRTSPVPVLAVDNKSKDANHNRGTGIFPAENHVLLLEDEPSYCLRSGLVWNLKTLEIESSQGKITGVRSAKEQMPSSTPEETMTFDAATRIWRGRELLSVEELVDEGTWPSSGKHRLELQALIGISWKPTPNGIFTRFHISDIWLDDIAISRATKSQTAIHKEFIRSRWMPAWIDKVEYGKFGTATVTATLFGGMDASLYADFKKGASARMNSVTDTLKHNHGAYGPSHMACRGPILDVRKVTGAVPLGSSGIQIQLKTDLITEGVRPGRIVRIWPGNWPTPNLPREEYINKGLMERYPTPEIFPNFE